ncbi:homocysteine S-methyltransferase YbgG [Solenopsis invicta]|uniref:homocysteine S-methyltransferase YbgG n=1 Tax=Solenopsis invicta TaxID=13686 RepID=UPI00193D6A3A|nr:homocysteine S-methyltransferase YbgG [Solenopsis invicta]XP_011174840.2 homocysteine S-methyltransferase YbgG [Solenopsis invicta]XP_025988305.2 homocysteine S-methyltransferase YbgG [Solenopsis invicta]XP_039309923.1 homocysteine S-methyltransferase YbgG [Solenopsis invicta]XP_039309926.1 homocysteine S-methyltransferase YbgG [Solenopsis invicta]XP_039309933.1 homocysteine S-methyltransferase YbgG [Solenopsis invicta]
MMNGTHVKILDGGFSGQLSRHVGTKIDGDPLWTARFLKTNVNAVHTTHLDFLRAGADIIETNTYQASLPGMMRYLNTSERESLDLFTTAVSLAKRAVEEYAREKHISPEQRPLIAGSCGPYGAYLHNASEYTGSYGKNMSQQELMDWHRPRVKALLDAGVDLLALETIPCIKEAEALLKLLKEYPHARAWLSFSCRDDKFISDGSVFQEMAVHCYRTLPLQIIAVGVNCIDPRHVTPLLKNINANASSKQDFIPLVVYPNRGGSCSATGEWTAVPDDHSLNLPISEWLDLGVRYIGGCCKIFAEDIKTIRSEVIRYQARFIS